MFPFLLRLSPLGFLDGEGVHRPDFQVILVACSPRQRSSLRDQRGRATLPHQRLYGIQTGHRPTNRAQLLWPPAHNSPLAAANRY